MAKENEDKEKILIYRSFIRNVCSDDTAYLEEAEETVRKLLDDSYAR